jgi:SAM-dependent methyltransferase
VLAVDTSAGMIQALKDRFDEAPTLGNEAAVRTWNGDICQLPLHQGRADVIFMNAVFGNLQDTRLALQHCCDLLVPGGHIVISHPLGMCARVP